MSEGRNASGLASALAQLGGMVGQSPPEGEQLEIFEPDTPLPVAQSPRPGPKGGRPKGSMNKSTKVWVDYLLQRYRSPLVALMELYSRSPHDLAEELGLYDYVIVNNIEGHPVYEKRLSTGEAFKRQVEAMIAALPYVHQKLPLEIHTNGEQKGGMLVIGDLNVTANYNADSAPTFLNAEAPATIDVTPSVEPQEVKP